MWTFTLHLNRTRRLLQALLHLAYPVGFCTACQRQTEWRDAGAAFVCRYCGADPVAGASGQET